MTTQSTTQAPSDVTDLAKNDNNLVWLDCEMSGLDPERERLLEIAWPLCAAIRSDKTDGFY